MSDYNDGLVPEPCLRLSCGFGQQYASVELGDGTGYVRVTDELRGEYHKMQRWYDDELRAALDENAKLRELVNLMAIEFSDMSNCSETPCPECPVSTECDREQQLMRELGIEVDE